MALSRTAEACSAGYMRNRLPQPMARIETEAPVRPRVRWGMPRPAAASAGQGAAASGKAAALTARPLLSGTSRRETFSRFAISPSLRGGLRRPHASGGQVLAHRLRVMRERHLGLLDLGMPLLLPFEAVVAPVAGARQHLDLAPDRHLSRPRHHVPAIRALGLRVLEVGVADPPPEPRVRLPRLLTPRHQPVVSVPEEGERGPPHPFPDLLGV